MEIIDGVNIPDELMEAHNRGRTGLLRRGWSLHGAANQFSVIQAACRRIG